VGYSPLVTADPPDGVFIDVAGASHLFQGEEALMRDLLERVRASGIGAKAAIADTPGCAWALARFSETAPRFPPRPRHGSAGEPSGGGLAPLARNRRRPP